MASSLTQARLSLGHKDSACCRQRRQQAKCPFASGCRRQTLFRATFTEDQTLHDLTWIEVLSGCSVDFSLDMRLSRFANDKQLTSKCSSFLIDGPRYAHCYHI